jgi:hypothetical protein
MSHEYETSADEIEVAQVHVMSMDVRVLVRINWYLIG